MSFKEVYITNIAHFFPNDPVSNDEMEEYLGYINNKPSKSKRIVLRNNGIKRRFYALSKGGKPTHTNAQMTAEAIKKLFKDNPDGLKSLELLSCGTSSPDQIMPSHACMVHGWLPESNAVEVVSPSGVCCAGMHAFKYAYMSVKTGSVNNAVASGSERFSAAIRSDIFEDEVQKLIELEENPYISFDKDFLRWMLSDGACAVKMSNTKNEHGINLRIDWIDGVSYANAMEPCMYAGSEKGEGGELKGYLDYTAGELLAKSVLSIKQDVKLLSENIVPLGGQGLKDICERNGLDVKDVDYFLPHMSSEFFKTKIYDRLTEIGLHIPWEKWRTNLSEVGNVGAGYIYLILDELFHSGELQKGQKILLLVPESSRFSYMYSCLTVV